MNYSLQLSVGGVPSAYDLSPSGDGLVVAAPGCLTFFKLNGMGSPRQVIHYEQPQQVRQVKFQRQGGAYISALRAGVVSLWEPSKKLRPLIGHVRSQGGWIADMAWSSSHVHMLATSCEGGYASLWDVRAPSWPVQQVTVGGVCSKIDWCPLNSNLLSVVAQSGQRLVVFDNRMVGSNGESVAVIEVEGGVTHASWFSGSLNPTPSQSTSTYTIVIGTGSGRLSYWDVAQSGSAAGGDALPTSLRSSQFANLASPLPGGNLINSNSHLLATPLGRGAIVCRSSSSDSGNNVPQVLRLQGCPRESLLNAFAPPDSRGTKGSFEYGPSIELASQGLNAPVLELKWGTPGRLIPSAHGGLELLALTESATLTAFRIPMDLVRKFCYSGSVKHPGGGGGSFGALTALEQAIPGDQVPPLTTVPPNLGPGPASLGPSRHPLTNLKSKWGQGAADAPVSAPLSSPRGRSSSDRSVPGSLTAAGVGGGASADNDRGGDRFWAGIRNDVLALEDAVGRDLLPGLSIGRIDQYARQVTIEMELPRERQSVGGRRRRESLGGSGIGGAGGVGGGEVIGADNSRIISLIVRFPFRGVPSFAIRGLEGADEAAAGAEISAELDTIAVTYFRPSGPGDFGSPPTSGSFHSRSLRLRAMSLEQSEEGFLLAVAHCLRTRCLQPLVPRALRKNSADLDGTDPDTGRDKDTVGKGDGEEGEGDAKDANARREADHVFIDPIAYRVPSPACSGARWSAKGVLLCFGGAVLVGVGASFEVVGGSGTTKADLTLPAATTAPTQDGEGDAYSRVYPKTLGDVLLMERAREEAYAQHMAFLKQTHAQYSAAPDDDNGSTSGRRGREGSSTGSSSSSNSSSSGESDSDSDSDGGSDSGPAEDASSASGQRVPPPESLSRSSSLRAVAQIRSGTVKLPQRSGSSESISTAGLSSQGSTDALSGHVVVASLSGPGSSMSIPGVPALGSVPVIRTSSGLSSSSGKLNYAGLDEHLLPLFDPTQAGQTLQSLGEDLDLIAKAEARTAGFRRTLPLAGNDSERTMWLAAAAAASTSAIMSQAPTRLSFQQIQSTLSQRLAEQYSLGPLPRHTTATAPGTLTAPVMTTDARGKRRVILDIKARAAACRSNAEVASKITGKTSSGGPCLPYSVQQMWSLLAVSLDLYAAAQENPDGLASEGGALLSWADGVLGCGLLRRIVLFLAGHQDVQLLATCVCVLGGPALTIELIRPGSTNQLKDLRRLLDRALSCYADVLSRWGALTKAVEVSKHETVFSQLHSNKQAIGESDIRAIGVGVTCSRCRAAASVITSANCSNPVAFWCADCRDFAVSCAVCMSSVRSTAYFCASCGHGGHPDHIKLWFEQSVECPTGCGCRCAELGLSLAASAAASFRGLRGSSDDDDDEEDDSDGGSEGDSDDSGSSESDSVGLAARSSSSASWGRSRHSATDFEIVFED